MSIEQSYDEQLRLNVCDVTQVREKQVDEGSGLFFSLGLLCLGVGLRQQPPDLRKAHYVLTPWPCVKGLAFSMWGFLSLGVCV